MYKFFGGVVVSRIYSYYILPKHHGCSTSIKLQIYPILYDGMIIIPYNKKAIHIHHWVIYFFILLVSLFYHIPEYIIGFSFGLFIQGVQYKDCCVFICDNPY